MIVVIVVIVVREEGLDGARLMGLLSYRHPLTDWLGDFGWVSWDYCDCDCYRSGGDGAEMPL